MAGDSMGSINLHQTAGLCLQPKASPESFDYQNNSAMLYLPDLFPTHTHKRKRYGYLSGSHVDLKKLTKNIRKLFEKDLAEGIQT